MEERESIRDMDMIGHDLSITVQQYLLSPDIPPSLRKDFEQLYMTFSKIMALGNIERFDVGAILKKFDLIKIFLDMRLYREAYDLMARLTMEMQLTRSIGGFQTLYGQGIQRIEEIKKQFSNAQANTPKGRFLGLLGRKPKQEESSMQQIGMEK